MPVRGRGMVHLLLLTAFGAVLQLSAQAQPIMADDYVELHRTRCYGSCPAYTVRIYGDGRVLWHGQDAVAVKGDAESHTDAFAARVLMQEFVRQGFWSLEDDKAVVFDSPNRRTILSIGGRTKAVFEFSGDGPAWLLDLDRKIDILADTHQWRHGDPASERFLIVKPGPRPWPESLIEEDTLKPKPGFTELMKYSANASESAGITKIEQTIHAGADVNVNAADASGWTPLMYAGRLGTAAIFKALLAAGARPDAVSKAGESVMDAVDSEYDFVDRAEKLAALRAALRE